MELSNKKITDKTNNSDELQITTTTKKLCWAKEARHKRAHTVVMSPLKQGSRRGKTN